MNYKLLMDTAVLAGEIMLCNGAETQRVEDTINRILQTDKEVTAQAVVFPTCFMVTLNSAEMKPMSINRRIEHRQTNLNKISIVNNLSRQYCAGKMELEKMYNLLTNIEEKQFSKRINFICFIIIAVAFTILLGGSAWDGAASGITGMVLSVILYLSKRIKFPSFIEILIAAFSIAVTAVILQAVSPINLNVDYIIAGGIMPLVPGVAITNAIRDTLQGDYLSGGARILESFVVAAAIAIGIGTGMSAAYTLIGGII